MRSLFEFMNDMIEKNPDQSSGVFILSTKNLKKFRESHGFSGEFKGHKVRGIDQAPDDKIYLVGEDEFNEIREALKNPIKALKNKDKNEDINQSV